MSNNSSNVKTDEAGKTGFSVALCRAFAAGQWAMGPQQIGHLVTEAADEIERLGSALSYAQSRDQQLTAEVERLRAALNRIQALPDHALASAAKHIADEVGLSIPVETGERRYSTAEIATVLKEHWITGTDCNESRAANAATCFCAVWRSAPVHSPCAAADKWIEHVLEHLAGKQLQQETGALPPNTFRESGEPHCATCQCFQQEPKEQPATVDDGLPPFYVDEPKCSQCGEKQSWIALRGCPERPKPGCGRTATAPQVNGN